jgi:DNA topoisomerase-3
VPGVEREDDCPMLFWKDTSGRYLDRESVRTLLAEDRTGVLDGFTARNGRTYKGIIEIDHDEWKLKVQSVEWNEGEGVSDTPEYEVNSDPLGECDCSEKSLIVETSTHFICQRKAGEDLAAAEIKGRKQAWKKEGKTPKEIRALAAAAASDAPPSCGFILPRTVCKREISRDEAEVYVRTGKTELLEDFTSRFGRPFSAILVRKETGRHGFEFPPRKARGSASEPDSGSEAAAGHTPKPARKSKKAPAKPKTAAKKRTSKRTETAAGGSKKKTAKKKSAKKNTTKKKSSKKKSAGAKRAAK